MAIPTTCPGCKAVFEVPDHLAGKTIRCTSCKSQMSVPAAAPAAPAAPAAAKKPFGFGAAVAAATPAAKSAPAAEPLPDDAPAAKTAPVSKPVPPPAKAKPAAKPADDEDDENANKKSSPNKAPAKSVGAALQGSGAKPKKKRDDDDDDDDGGDDQPKKKKRKGETDGQKSMIVMIGGGFLTLCSLAGSALWLFSGKKEEPAKTDTSSSTDGSGSAGGSDPVALGFPGAAGGWKPFRVDELTAEFPGTPTTPPGAPATGPGGKFYALQNPAKTSGFFVMCVTAPGPTDGPFAQSLLNNMAAEFERGMASGRGGFGEGMGGRPVPVRVASKTDITQDGCPGKEIQIVAKDGGPAGGVMRIVLFENKVYVFGAAGDNYAPMQALGQKFMASVKIAAIPPGFPADVQWKPYTIDGLTADLPGDPQQTQVVGNGRKSVVIYPPSRKEALYISSTSHQDLSTAALENESRAFEGHFNNVGGLYLGIHLPYQIKVANKTDITHEGFPGKEFQVVPKDDPGRPGPATAGGLVRFVQTAEKIYVFAAFGHNFAGFKEQADKFMASVKITGPSLPKVEPGFPASAEWKPFTTDGFAADLPGNPFTTQMQYIFASRASVYTLENQKKTAGFVVLVATVPANNSGNQTPAQILDVAVSQIPFQLNRYGAAFGRLMVGDKTDVAQDGIPGKEFQLVEQGGGKGGGVGRAVVTVTPTATKVYLFGAAATDQAGFKEQADKFMASVKVTGTAVAGNPNPNPNPNPIPNQPDPNADAKLKTKIDPFFAAAFDAPNKELYTVTSRVLGGKVLGTLSRYKTPDFAAGGRFKLPYVGTRAVIDPAKGLLYVATATAALPNQFGQPQTDPTVAVGDVAVFDLNLVRTGKVEDGTDLKPLGTMTVGKQIRGMELSPDGKTLYVVTTIFGKPTKSQLLKFDTETRKPSGMPKDLPEPVWDVCRSPDGKNLIITEIPGGAYGTDAAVRLYDPVAMSSVKPAFPIKGTVNDIGVGAGAAIAACVTDPPMGGGIGVPPPNPGAAKLKLVSDVGAREFDLGPAAGGAANNGYAEYSPNGKVLFVSSVRGPGLDVYEVVAPEAVNGLKRKAAVKTAGKQDVGGHFHVTPDGEYLLFRSGHVVEVAGFGIVTEGAGGTEPKVDPPKTDLPKDDPTDPKK